MEYYTKEKDYSLSEFYKLYKDKLPIIIKVTEGFCAEILEETFDYGQVIRIHSVGRQRRVIAIRFDDHGTEECTYSFPVNYPLEFYVGEIYKNDKETLTLEQVLDRGQLPVDVEISSKSLNKSESSTSGKGPFIILRLTKLVDEPCLLGNFIFDGEFDLHIVRIPLHLYAIRFSEVTGMRDKSKSDWVAFQTKLDKEANQLNFDAISGNPEIVKRKPISSFKINSKELETASFLYQNVQTTTYTNVRELLEKTTQSSQSETASEAICCIYETVDLGPTACKQDKETGNKLITKEKDNQKKNLFQLHFPQQDLLKELTTRFSKDPTPSTKPTVGSKPPILKPKPILKGNTKESSILKINTVGEMSGKAADNYSNPVPPRPLSCSQPEHDVRNTSFGAVNDFYENMKIGRAEVNPIVCLKSGTLPRLSKAQQNQYALPNVESQLKSLIVEQNEDIKDQAAINVKDFKVHELGKWMKDKLRLGKYAEHFAEQLVDGATLLDLDENILKQEFGFSSIEAKRLMKFAKDGHVPQ